MAYGPRGVCGGVFLIHNESYPIIGQLGVCAIKPDSSCHLGRLSQVSLRLGL